MFSKIALLVLQEQVKTKKYADVWRVKAKARTSAIAGEQSLKRRMSKPNLRDEVQDTNTKHQKKLIKTMSTSKLNAAQSGTSKSQSDSSLGQAEKRSADSKGSKQKEFRKAKKERNKCSNEVFEEVMAEIQKFTKEKSKRPPTSNPNSLALDLPGGRASHEDVYYQIKNLVNLNRGCRIVSLQYLPLESRWLILMDSKESCDRISGQSIKINGTKVFLKRYDDVITLEYKKVSRANGFINNVKEFD